VALAFSSIPLMMAASHQGYLLLGVGRLSEMNRVRVVPAFSYAAVIVLLKALDIRAADPYVAAFWCAQLISCGLAMYFCRRLGARLHFGTEGLKEVLFFGAKTQLGSLSAQANLRFDQLLMSLWLAPFELGLYVVAVALSSLASPVFGALSLVVTPAVLQAPDRRQGAARACRHLGFAVLAGAPIALGGVLAARYLLQFLFGPQFALALTMARILFVASLFQGMNQLSGAALSALGMPGRLAIGESLGAAITLFLLAILLPRQAAVGAAVTSLAAYAVVCVIQVSSLLAIARKGAPHEVG
jgi:O-antigen/teichoic acid export membrane protein